MTLVDPADQPVQRFVCDWRAQYKDWLPRDRATEMLRERAGGLRRRSGRLLVHRKGVLWRHGHSQRTLGWNAGGGVAGVLMR
jgi:hypothetical protein